MSQHPTGADALTVTQATEPSHKHGWLAVASITSSTFTVVTSEILPVGLLTNIAKHYQVSDGTVGWMMTAPAATAAVAALALSLLVGRMDRRWIFLLLSSLMLLANLVLALAPSFGWMIAARVLSGFCVGGIWTFSFAAARRMVPEADGGKAVAWVLAGVSAGSVLGVPTGAMLSTLIGWQWAFAALAGLAAVSLFLQWLCLPRLPAQNDLKAKHLLAVLQNPHARAVLVFLLLAITGQFCAYTYLKPLLGKFPSITGQAVSSLLLAYGVAGFVGNFMGERLAAWRIKSGLLLGSALLAAVTLILASLNGASILLMGALLLVWGIAYGILPVAIQIGMYSVVPPKLIEGSSALIVVAFQVAIGLGALLGGLVVDRLGISSVMLSGTLLAGLALLWVVFGKVTKD